MADDWPVRTERSGWRDEAISERHRHWGFNCPATDLDWLVVEYNLGLPVALVEYKHYRAVKPNLRHPTYRALADLADGYKDAGLPFFYARYWPDVWAFECFPVNKLARSWFAVSGDRLSEQDYVTKLYRMRSRMIMEVMVRKLNTDLPPEEVG